MSSESRNALTGIETNIEDVPDEYRADVSESRNALTGIETEGGRYCYIRGGSESRNALTGIETYQQAWRVICIPP